MVKTVYRQLDKRWKNLPFPGGGYTIGGQGCGCCAVTHVLMEFSKYTSWTPANVQPYMKKWAVKAQGLIHDGIPDSLKHYGISVTSIGIKDPMSKAWEVLNKSGRHGGVLLFYGKSGKKALYGPDGTRWTASGHFIAFVDYKVVSGKHWLYLKDSGDRVSTHVNIDGKKVKESHDGWWCYENSMKGCLPKLWIVSIPDQKTKEPQLYSGEFPSPKFTDTTTVNNAAKIVAKAKEIAWPPNTDSKKYAWDGGSATNAFKNELNRVYPDRSGWSKKPKKGCSCDVGAGTTIRASGIDLNFPRGLSEQVKYNSASMQKIVKTNVTPYSVAEPGDAVIYFGSDGKPTHIFIMGNKVIYEAQYKNETYFHTNSSLSKIQKKKSKVIIFRAKPTTETTTRKNLKKGDFGSEVVKLQKYINWFFYDKYGKNVLEEDGHFGPNTETYTKKMQTELGLKADGIAGPKTLAAMKEAKR